MRTYSVRTRRASNNATNKCVFLFNYIFRTVATPPTHCCVMLACFIFHEVQGYGKGATTSYSWFHLHYGTLLAVYCHHRRVCVESAGLLASWPRVCKHSCYNDGHNNESNVQWSSPSSSRLRSLVVFCTKVTRRRSGAGAPEVRAYSGTTAHDSLQLAEHCRAPRSREGRQYTALIMSDPISLVVSVVYTIQC